MTDTTTNITKHVTNYYRYIRGYHQLVEDQPHEAFVVPPELLRRHMNLEGLTVDVAGGSGINAKLLEIPADKYVCVDVSAEGLKLASERKRGVCVQVDVGELPLKSASADNMLCSWALEHMTDPESALNEMIRIVKPGGHILVWGPNWDNIFRKDFPQFVHKSPRFIRRVRWQIFWRMIKNEFGPFHFNPYINLDVAALVDPIKHISGDSDAVHCVLCQETVKFFRKRGLRVLHIADFSEMGVYLRNDLFIRFLRRLLVPLLPVLRWLPLLRWFVIRFPVIVEKPL